MFFYGKPGSTREFFVEKACEFFVYFDLLHTKTRGSHKTDDTRRQPAKNCIFWEKRSRKNDLWLIQLFTRKPKFWRFLLYFLRYLNFRGWSSENICFSKTEMNSISVTSAKTFIDLGGFQEKPFFLNSPYSLSGSLPRDKPCSPLRPIFRKTFFCWNHLDQCRFLRWLRICHSVLFFKGKCLH